jgi:hypothetical protein
MNNKLLNETSAVTLFSGGGRNNLNSTVVSGQVTLTALAKFAVKYSLDGMNYASSLSTKSNNLKHESSFAPLRYSINVLTVNEAMTSIGIIDHARYQINIMQNKLAKAKSKLLILDEFKAFVNKLIVMNCLPSNKDSTLLSKISAMLFSASLSQPSKAELIQSEQDTVALGLDAENPKCGL